MARILVTGGAGFIGTNLTNRLLRSGHQVTVFDNLSRRGCVTRLGWLMKNHSENLRFIKGDITEEDEVLSVCEDMEFVFHFAGQTAVADSVLDPRRDFEENALGTLNLLEAARAAQSPPAVILASTNKVYGRLKGLPVVKAETRYCFPKGIDGISEEQPLDPHSPYACSKAVADHYALDYFRVYGLRTVVMRQSCIYGPWQFGCESQGWLAWLMLAALQSLPITVFGDGRQVRDILFVEDLLDAYEAAMNHIDDVAGSTYNIGGGPSNSISVWREFGPLLEDLVGTKIEVNFSAWRAGDQKIYVSDIGKAERELGWIPKIQVENGLENLFEWLSRNYTSVEIE